MNLTPCQVIRSCVMIGLFFVFVTHGAFALTEPRDIAPEPAFYLNFNEGSGNVALDASGNGNAGTINNATRVENGGCGEALLLSRADSYVAVPFRSQNHPTKEITVSAWFYAENFQPGVLVSGYNAGGYRIAFDDGDDLWWTVNLEGIGDVSVPVRHEGISLHEWHHVAGTYDGKLLKIYLDGVLLNQAEVTGVIHYQNANYVMIGAAAGPRASPDQQCPRYFKGGIDEVRIYPVALTYSQVLDDRFRCSHEPGFPAGDSTFEASTGTCDARSGLFNERTGNLTEQVLSFSSKTQNGIWQISQSPGSTLRVQAFDLYSDVYPDAWSLEIDSNNGTIMRTVSFPERNNTPMTAILPSGNGTVLVKYFEGGERFPSQVILRLESLPAPRPIKPAPQTIMTNPIIVIYSASWITLIAIILGIVWLHRRRNVPKS